MGRNVDLVKTLDFQLEIQSGDEADLRFAARESRRAYNETVRLAKEGVESANIAPTVADEVDLVRNTTQRIVNKALDAVENGRSQADVCLPSHTKSDPYPIRANYTEGYDLTLDDGEVAFRISTKPYNPVRGVLRGSDVHLDLLKSALCGSGWEIGTAEALFRRGDPELHVTVTKTDAAVRRPEQSETIIGVDVNEDNVALAALSDDGVEETLVVEYPEVKSERHRYLTIRKRIQKAGKTSQFESLEQKEKRFVRDRLHKLSNFISEFANQFESPCIVFEDLKDIREGLDLGARMNQRIHRIPFGALQSYTTYKASFSGIPTMRIDPEYTSQMCAVTDCEHTTCSNRRKNRFRCRACGHQDHADRNAALNVAKRGVRALNWNVPALNNLPQVRKVRRRASGAVDAPSVTHDAGRGDQTDGVVGVFE
ncbi:RNA-guided endonuclease InsQ/TnpB family protein [Halobacterium litoreum]|uniref:RNA-guided endonuclease InsQ/TnpB family protein n=1 Tax=Halobacterium litoreum TaxID=2039234 RepID=A0ABD5NI66_9EURY|nr:transposase [Halobacterium litoreum]UHH12491.1 transposase [Halobacterium litoreum]